MFRTHGNSDKLEGRSECQPFVCVCVIIIVVCLLAISFAPDYAKFFFYRTYFLKVTGGNDLPDSETLSQSGRGPVR